MFYKVTSLGNLTNISRLRGQQSTPLLLGAVDDLMHCCTLGNGASGRPEHRGSDSIELAYN